MSLPREVIPGRYYMITRRCTQRQYLLRPDKDVNQAYEYCLALAAEKHSIDVLLTCAMSNHHHTVIYDSKGNYPLFMEHFHKLLARCLNALRDRSENFWSSDQPCVVRLLGITAVLDKLTYVATNPIKANLVEEVHQWPGVNRYEALLSQRTVTIERPKFFFREHGKMPKTITLRYGFPKHVEDPQPLLTALRERVRKKVVELRDERRRNRRSVMGAKAVCLVSWSSKPRTKAKRNGLRPTLAGRDMWRRAEALQRNQEFLEHYELARKSLADGEVIPFPRGTYWLRRFVAVPIGPPPKKQPPKQNS